MRRDSCGIAIGVFLVCTLCWSSAAAQQPVTLRTDVLFYGDDTEFRNPFREGETIFGAALWLAAAVEVGDRVTLQVGGFADQRFGSEDAFERVRPVLSLTVRGARSTFVFGTLPPPSVDAPSGPDRGGPHALLPVLQRETLAFDRPYENGLAWNFTGQRLRQQFWLEWQRLNTPEHRERFDGGIAAAVRLSDAVSLPLQLHVVHEGGQLFATGPVADSTAAAAGIDVHRNVAGGYRAGLELFGLVSKHVPDRGRPDLSLDGRAFFGRASAERSGWRAHVIVWRGRNFIKDEGDMNYMSVERSGVRDAGTRNYAEAGLTRRYRLAPAAILEASGRFHRIESRSEYSFRITAVVTPSWRIR